MRPDLPTGTVTFLFTDVERSTALLRELGAEATIVRPGVDLARFAPSPRPAGARRVLYLGGDVPHKGVDVARELADTVVGPGLAEVDPAEVPVLMAAHDVLLVPSLEEPYGMVAAEAIALLRQPVVQVAEHGAVFFLEQPLHAHHQPRHYSKGDERNEHRKLGHARF